jgi:hypothetical protein
MDQLYIVGNTSTNSVLQKQSVIDLCCILPEIFCACAFYLQCLDFCYHLHTVFEIV